MDRSEMIRRASTLPVGDPERKRLLSHLKTGAKFDRPRRLLVEVAASSLKKAQSAYDFNDASNDDEVLHHLAQALYDIAWVVREIGDPQAEKLMDVTRNFSSQHR